MDAGRPKGSGPQCSAVRGRERSRRARSSRGSVTNDLAREGQVANSRGVTSATILRPGVGGRAQGPRARARTRARGGTPTRRARGPARRPKFNVNRARAQRHRRPAQRRPFSAQQRARLQAARRTARRASVRTPTRRPCRHTRTCGAPPTCARHTRSRVCVRAPPVVVSPAPARRRAAAAPAPTDRPTRRPPAHGHNPGSRAAFSF